MRLPLSMEEYDNLVEKLVLHDEQELVKLIRDKFKKSLPSKEGMSNKQEAGKNARKKVENINNKKIDIAIVELIRRKEAITVTNVSKEAKLSYNTANKYKVRIKLAASEEKNKKENPHLFH